MDLAKPCIDVGLFTNRLDEMRAFYAQRVGLQFEEMLPVGGGVRQYRYGLRGSVLKINHSRDPLPASIPGGYRRLVIAERGLAAPTRLADPDGNEIELTPAGRGDVNQIEVQIGVTDEAAFERFYGEALEAQRLGPGRLRLGETVISFARDPAATRAAGADGRDASGVIAQMRAIGLRYMTIQVRDCDSTHRRLLSLGVSEGAAPSTLGTVARISFIRDPDGNWIEISQRASLTGPLPA